MNNKPNLSPAPSDQPEPKLPIDPPLPDSHPLDEKIMTEFARKYNEYRQAALEPSPFFADLCLYVRDNQIGETQLLDVLKDNLKMPPKSAVEAARRILYFIEGADAEIWQDLSNGKITVSDARKNWIKEREDKVKMKPESVNVPTEASAEPTPAGQPELFERPKKRKSEDKFENIEGVRCRFTRYLFEGETLSKFCDVFIDDPHFPTARIVYRAVDFDHAKDAACSHMRQLLEEPPLPGQPDPPAAAAYKEKRAKAKHRNPLINQPPLSPEERAARNAAAAARWAETDQERESAKAAALKERKARQAEGAAKQKERIAKLREQLLSGEIDDPYLASCWLTPGEQVQARKARMIRRKKA